MRTGRPPLELGTHGKVSTYDIDGRTRAIARMRTWDGDIHQVTAVGDTAPDARALLERRMAIGCDCQNSMPGGISPQTIPLAMLRFTGSTASGTGRT